MVHVESVKKTQGFSQSRAMEDTANVVRQTHFGDPKNGLKPNGKKVLAKPKVPGAPVPADDTIVQHLYKTKMCYHWQSGYCMMGNRCNFAHGIHELRIPRSFLVNEKGGQGPEVGVPDSNLFNPSAFNDAHAAAATRHGAAPTASYELQAASNPEAAAYNRVPIDQHGGNQAVHEVEGKLASAILHGQNDAVNNNFHRRNPSGGDENQNYFQVEGNHDKPFGEQSFNGGQNSGLGSAAPARNGGVSVKNLKVKIAKVPENAIQMEEQAESVKTPKWAGWLLDSNSPRGDYGGAQGGNGAGGVSHVPHNTACPMCGHVEVDTDDAGVQCDLYPLPPLSHATATTPGNGKQQT